MRTAKAEDKPVRHLIDMTLVSNKAVSTTCGLIITGQEKFFLQTTNLVEDTTCKRCQSTVQYKHVLAKVIYRILRDSA